jgi:hypothetical protein
LHLRQPVTATHNRFELSLDSNGGYRVCGGGLTLLEFSGCDTAARLDATTLDQLDVVDVLRWGAPFALAQRGMCVLHAACVAQHGRAIALVAPGGTGKSTLAATLVEAGWQRVADDALLCSGAHVDPRAEVALRAWCRAAAPQAARTHRVDFASLADELRELASTGAHAAGHAPAHRLAAIVFLQLPRTRDGSFACQPVSPVTGFDLLAQHGFGAAPGVDAWLHEARAYTALANTVPLWTASAPEGMHSMHRALAGWLAQVLPASSGGDIAGGVPAGAVAHALNN